MMIVETIRTTDKAGFDSKEQVVTMEKVRRQAT